MSSLTDGEAHRGHPHLHLHWGVLQHSQHDFPVLRCFPCTFAGTRFPIQVYPSSIIIPPHEYRHVTLAFCPKALQQYTATFEAIAVGGAADPATAGFTCEIRGEGALPSLNFQVRHCDSRLAWCLMACSCSYIVTQTSLH